MALEGEEAMVVVGGGGVVERGVTEVALLEGNNL
jgi:hypothetical protein